MAPKLPTEYLFARRSKNLLLRHLREYKAAEMELAKGSQNHFCALTFGGRGVQSYNKVDKNLAKEVPYLPYSKNKKIN